MFLYNLFIEPFKLLFETLFSVLNTHLNSIGLSVILMSVLLKLFGLPLYKTEKSGQREIDFDYFKNLFKGKVKYNSQKFRFLKNFGLLFLEIISFIAIYDFFSNLNIIKEKSIMFLSDISLPDALLKIGKTHINILPVLFLIISLISNYIYTKNFTLFEKIRKQVISVGIFIALYKAPSLMVCYYLVQINIELIRNIIVKFLKFNKFKEIKKKIKINKSDKFIIAVGMLFNTVLGGILIPSAIIYTSPEEFINLNTLD